LLHRYGNNCPETNGPGRGPKYCSEHGKLETNWQKALAGDVAALIQYVYSPLVVNSNVVVNSVLNHVPNRATDYVSAHLSDSVSYPVDPGAVVGTH
jgi:hypothetical protein